MSSRVRPAALAVAALCSWVAIGCSDGGDASDGDGARDLEDVASSWGEIDPQDEERASSYLAGRGAPLLAYADFAVRLDERLDDAAYADKCADLRAEWDESFPPRRTLDRLYALPDPILGRLWTSQIPATESALRACADGDRERSAQAAEQAAVLDELVERRLDELGVDR